MYLCTYVFILCFILIVDISELDIEEIEPIVIEKINLMLGSYPYGYRVTLKDFHVHGLSNLTVNQIKYLDHHVYVDHKLYNNQFFIYLIFIYAYNMLLLF
jgi:hypothetical protein